MLTADLDDGGSPSQFTQQVHTAIDQDHAFAVGVASAWFTPGYFVSTDTPTYGYNVSANWETAPNLFAAGRLDPDLLGRRPDHGLTSSRRPSPRRWPSSATARRSPPPTTPATPTPRILKTAGYNINFVDVGAQLGGSYASDVQRMQQAGSDLVVSCMQASDNITMARDIQQYGLNIKQLWLNGYDQTLLNQYASLMQGVYLNITGTVPFEAGHRCPSTATRTPGMQQYIAAMNKYEPDVHLQRRGLPGLAVGRPAGRRDQGGGQRPDPGQRHRPGQQDHRLQRRRRRRRPVDWTVGPHRQHAPDVQRLRPGPGHDVRPGARARASRSSSAWTGTPGTRCRWSRPRRARRAREPPARTDQVGADPAWSTSWASPSPASPTGAPTPSWPSGLVLTYQATGVFNFAYGAQAYLSAFLFTRLVQNEHLPVWLAFVLSVVVLGPAVGLAFDRLLFRKIANTNTTAKLVTGISLFVGIPAVLAVLFGSANQYNPPSILFNPDTVYFRVAGTPINGIYVTTVLTTVVVLVALGLLLRFSNLGLQMRGSVESRRLIELDGVNAGRVVAVAWAISGFMAGLAGVLLAPIYPQLQFSDYAALMVAAFAAAAWAVLRSLTVAALVGVLMGVLTTTLQGYLPVDSVWSSALFTSLPFIVLVAALLLVPGLRTLDRTKDPLSSVDPPTPADHRHPARPADRPGGPDRAGTSCWSPSSCRC